MTDREAKPPATSTTEGPRDPWHVFRAWHGDEALWRDIYVRSVSALIAAFVIYLVAVFTTGVTKTPVIIVFAIAGVVSVALLLFSVPVAAKHWSYFKPLFVVWNENPDPRAVLAREAYNRFIFGVLGTIISVGFLALLLSGV